MSEIFILVIFLIVFPFSLKVKISIDAFRNIGFVFVYLFGIIPIYFQKFEINKGVIKFIKNPQKIKEVKLSFKREDVKKFNNKFSIILNSQIVKSVDINTKFGIKNSPSLVAIISGFYNLLIGNFLSINTAKGNIIKSKSNIRTYFKYTYLKSEINIKIKFSLLQLLSILFQIKVGVKV